MSKTLIVGASISTLLACNTSFAHVDSRIEIRDGALIGLPASYQPSTFDRTSLTLRIGSRKMSFPVCIKKYFDEIENHKLEVAASWYHETNLLPEYLAFEISSPKYQYKYNLLFNMNTLQPLWFQIWTTKNGMYLHDILIGDLCMKSAHDATEDA